MSPSHITTPSGRHKDGKKASKTWLDFCKEKNILFELESLAIVIMDGDTSLFLLSTSKPLPHMGVKLYSIAS